MATKAVRANLDTVYVKFHDGTKVSQNFNKDLMQAFLDAKRKVVLWGYNYATDPIQEADLIIKYLHMDGVYGYAYDAESHVKNKKVATKKMAIRVMMHRDTCSKCRNKVLIHAPLAWPSRHQSFPYPELGMRTDGTAPQLYWDTMGRSPAKVVNITFKEWSAWEAQQIKAGRKSAINPLLPVGQIYDSPYGGKLTFAEVKDFVIKTRGYHSISFWDWQHASPEMWSAIKHAKQWRKKPLPRRRMSATS